MNHLVTFGKDKITGKLLNISEVPSGLACNCVCSFCGSDLEAHKGTVQRHHFQHYSSADCVGAFESQIHLLAKEIIEENKCLMLPKYIGQFSIIREKRQDFSEIVLELSQDDLRPDCICKYLDEQGNEQTLWVEILNSHAVDGLKAEKICERHIACVEIDVSQLFKDKETVDKETLTEFLLNSAENRKWINNPLGDERILAEADEVRKNGSIVDFLNSGYKEECIENFYPIMYCLFLKGYRLSSEDYKNFYYTVKLHSLDYRTLNPVAQWLFVSVVQMLLCHLFVTGKINDGKCSREQQLSFVCFKLNSSNLQFSEWIKIVLQYPSQGSQSPHLSRSYNSPRYIVKGNRFVKFRRF